MNFKARSLHLTHTLASRIAHSTTPPCTVRPIATIRSIPSPLSPDREYASRFAIPPPPASRRAPASRARAAVASLVSFRSSGARFRLAGARGAPFLGLRALHRRRGRDRGAERRRGRDGGRRHRVLRCGRRPADARARGVHAARRGGPLHHARPGGLPPARPRRLRGASIGSQQHPPLAPSGRARRDGVIGDSSSESRCFRDLTVRGRMDGFALLQNPPIFSFDSTKHKAAGGVIHPPLPPTTLARCSRSTRGGGRSIPSYWAARRSPLLLGGRSLSCLPA